MAYVSDNTLIFWQVSGVIWPKVGLYVELCVEVYPSALSLLVADFAFDPSGKSGVRDGY